MTQIEHFSTGSFVEILTLKDSTGKRNKQGTVVGPAIESGKAVVEHHPGTGSGHYAPKDLKAISKLRKVNWNHSLSSSAFRTED